MKYFHFQLEYIAGDNYSIWEDHIMPHPKADCPLTREDIIRDQLLGSWEHAEVHPVDDVIILQGGELTVRIAKHSEITEEEFEVMNKYIFGALA